MSDLPRNSRNEHESDGPRPAAVASTDPASERTDANRQSASARKSVIDREKEQFGGFKFGCAFFGWLTATGTTVILAALATGIGVAVGLSGSGSTEEAADATAANADTVGVVGAIVLGIILLIAYYCGGYVAGRMARFSGLKQGLAVWLWALVILIIVTIIGAIAGGNLDLSGVATLPAIPLDAADLTGGAVLGLLGALVVSLAGALLGGLAGMRFHRRVDIAGLGR